jgi:peptidoglycan hydrolase CwlO-like protein
VTTKEHLTKHDREIAAIRLLIKTGMKMIVRIQESQAAIQESQAATRKDLRDLAASQKKTDASLKALIDQMRRSGGNGHTKGNMDVQ